MKLPPGGCREIEVETESCALGHGLWRDRCSAAEYWGVADQHAEPEAKSLAALAGCAPEGLDVTREGLAEYIRGRLARGRAQLGVPGPQSGLRRRDRRAARRVGLRDPQLDPSLKPRLEAIADPTAVRSAEAAECPSTPNPLASRAPEIADVF